MIIPIIKLNFLENFYMFYDWLKTDSIREFRNIPVIRVSTKTLYDFISSKIKLDKNGFKSPTIFSDTFNYVAVIFDECGYSLLKSSLMLKDEFEINKKIDNLKEEKIIYKTIFEENHSNELRINNEIKRTINLELNKIKRQNNIEKITYLYYELFQKKSNNLDKMYNDITRKINNNLTSKDKYIYEILKKDYKLV